MKTINLHIQEAQQTPNKRKQGNNTRTHRNQILKDCLCK